MVISTEQLKIQPERIISEINRVQEITITYLGKPSAKIVPIFDSNSNLDESANELFGIWKNREDTEDVNQYIRNMRRGRKL